MAEDERKEKADRAKLAELRRRKVLENQKGRWDTLGVENPPPKLVEVGSSSTTGMIPTLPPGADEMLQKMAEEGILPSMQPALRAVGCAVLALIFIVGFLPVWAAIGCLVVLQLVLRKNPAFGRDAFLFFGPIAVSFVIGFRGFLSDALASALGGPSSGGVSPQK